MCFVVVFLSLTEAKSHCRWNWAEKQQEREAHKMSSSSGKKVSSVPFYSFKVGRRKEIEKVFPFFPAAASPALLGARASTPKTRRKLIRIESSFVLFIIIILCFPLLLPTRSWWRKAMNCLKFSQFDFPNFLCFSIHWCCWYCVYGK